MLTSDDWPVYDGTAIAGNEAHICAVPLGLRQSDLQTLIRSLSPDEKERASEFRVDDARRRFVIARLALRMLLGNFLGLKPVEVALVQGAYQKPMLGRQLAASGLYFNVSHSGELALIAITSHCEIGVDVEQVRSVGHLEQISKKYFHPAETDAVLGAPAEDRTFAFLRVWTAKEAVLKAIGTGITGSLADFQVSVDEKWCGWIECGGSQCWVQRLALGKDYEGAVSCVGSQRSVRCWTFDVNRVLQ